MKADDWTERVLSEAKSVKGDADGSHKLIYRLLGSYQYASSLIPRKHDLVIVNSIEEAIKYHQDIKPSEDGERVYTLMHKPVTESVESLQQLFIDWPWDYGAQDLADKLLEEATEMASGGMEPPKRNDDVFTFIGTSAASEALTTGIVSLKFLSQMGVSVRESIELLALRHHEQYKRYKSSN